MTTEPAPQTVYVYQRRGCGSGCLWGCLAVIVLVSLPVLFAAGWGVWFWTHGFRRDPAFRLVVQLIQQDSLAHRVMGADIVVAGIDSSNFGWLPGMSRHDYAVTLEGPSGEGELAVSSHADASGPHLDSAILTGPDGRRYDLLKDEILPGGRPDDSI